MILVFENYREGRQKEICEAVDGGNIEGEASHERAKGENFKRAYGCSSQRNTRR